MDIKIDSIQMQYDMFEVKATFTQGSLSVSKVNSFRGTKADVEQWLKNEADQISQSLKTVEELRVAEKNYVYDKGVLTTKAEKAV